MSDVRFTSTISMTVVRAPSDTDEYFLLRVHAPVFAVENHSIGQWVRDGKIDPAFYIDESPQCSEASAWILRGATQAHCEKTWEVFTILEAAGAPVENRKTLLPSNLMTYATVWMKTEELQKFIADCAYHPVAEVRTIAEGFQRALEEQSSKDKP